MENLEGYVERIVYRNDANGYTVFSLVKDEGRGDEDEITCVGNYPFIEEGMYISVQGSFSTHSTYGSQLQVTEYHEARPRDAVAMERYLASGAIKGIGKALAARLVKKFAEDTFDIIENAPERLAEVKGISEKLAREVYKQFKEKQDMRDAMLFLQDYGISGMLAAKIYKQYGNGLYTIIKENPYKLTEDLQRVGFRITDAIAEKAGIRHDSEYRIQAGMVYLLLQAVSNGHVYLPAEELIFESGQLLGLPSELCREQLIPLQMSKKVISKKESDEEHVYSYKYYFQELSIARILLDLNVKTYVGSERVKSFLDDFEGKEGISLDELQKSAVIGAVSNGLFVLTGGPGTGKTTTINAMLQFFEKEGKEILLAAPTGRAAKRMSEATGYEAKTIHRLLELTGGTEGREDNLAFQRDEDNPLEADVLIIDEMSMVDVNLMHALLRAVTVGTQMILVGDVDQLPSVGPGNVLHDIIESGKFGTVKLNRIFRQAGESDIVVNAHKINAGEGISLDNKSRDFFFLERGRAEDILGVTVALVRDKLPKYVSASVMDIQVLTPMKKGELGVERLNQVLQQYLNPPDRSKGEREAHGSIFRTGDKVMQVRNNYQAVWEVRNKNGYLLEKGEGIYNGDIGIIKDINSFSESMEIVFDDGKSVDYPFSQLEELELAYAITIHKSQGSEYPAVVLPLLSGPRLLCNRNILYTAVTRAKSCVTIVGSRELVQHMIDNKNEQKRYTSLCTRIIELG